MAKGGKRPGAGRKFGSKGKVTALIRKIAMEGGELPLDLMLRVMRDDATPAPVRLDLAKACAPYLHPKLANVTHSGDPNHPITTVTKIERVVTNGPIDGENAEAPYSEGLPTTH